ncbi:MAG TPA: MFS transporter [Terrimicrobiaceae bacterium]|nr:MFS transporter [Terrimicrobiaceae bacterium]
MRRNAPQFGNFERLAYGAGELGPAMAGSTIIFFQLVFLTDVAGMDPGLAGSILLLARIWDAVNDPLIGWLSDHTKTPWGRRLPWIVVSALPFSAFFMMFWLVPEFVGPDAPWSSFAYYLIVAVLFSTFSTALGLPHASLTAELSRDYDERSRLTAYRMGFSLAGSVGGLVAALLVFQLLKDAPKSMQYAVFGTSIGIIALVAVLFCLAGIWRIVMARDVQRLRRESADELAARPLPFREQVDLVLGNKPFLLVCGIYLCSWLSMQFTATILPYFTQSWLGLSNTTFHLLALTVQTTALCLIPLWGWISVKIGKKPVYFIGMSFWLVAQAGLMFLQPGATGLFFIMAFVAGFGISVCYLIPNAMLPDVVEYDELKTGRRREGVYYGTCIFVQKTALAIGTFIAGQLLAFSGYIPTGPNDIAPSQPESALLAIRLAIGPLPALALVIGMVLTALYPVTRESHRQVVEEIDARRRPIP